MLALGGCFSYLGSDVVRDQLSAYACLGMIRAYLCGESELWAIEPNARDGLCIPIARAIEQQGGAVWRGRRVTKVITEGRQGGTVILEDGTEVSAPAIAMAGGNHRMGALLDVLPPAVEECLRYEAEESPVPQLEEFAIFARLDKPVDVEPRMFSFIVSPDLTSLHATWSTDAVAPWTVDPGTYCLVTETVLTPDQIAQRGGRDAVFAAMPDATEELHPGYKDAVFAEVNTRYPTWQTPFRCGPKMPRTVEDVRGLYFVGEGSAPTCGLYMEGSASAGILGARTIAADRTA
jgi:phytoene dehydrogenase-like protein